MKLIVVNKNFKTLKDPSSCCKYMYMYIQFGILIFHVDFSNKKATSVPDDVWEVAMKAGVTSVNLSKNQFTDLPSKFVFLCFIDHYQ